MVWIPLLKHPDKLDKPTTAKVNTISSHGEKTNKDENIGCNESGISNQPIDLQSMESPTIALDASTVTPFESVPNLSDVTLKKDSLLSLSNCNKDRKVKITELMTKEQLHTVEEYYTIDMNVVDKKRVQSQIIVRKEAGLLECNICSSKYYRRDKCEVCFLKTL